MGGAPEVSAALGVQHRRTVMVWGDWVSWRLEW